MRRVEISIDENIIDYNPSDVPAQIILNIESLNGVRSSVAGAYSKRTIKIPYTKKNSTVFGLPSDNGLTTQQYYLKRKFSIYIDGLSVFNGICQISHIDSIGLSYNRQGSYIYLDVMGNNSAWMDDAKSTHIKDLNWYDTDHILSYTSTIAGMTAIDANEPYAYALIKYKNWLNPDFVIWQEFTACIFVYRIIKKFFDGLGYTINSNFLDSNLGQRLIIPIPLKQNGEYSIREKLISKNDVVQTFSLDTDAAVIPPIFPNITFPDTLPYNVIANICNLNTILSDEGSHWNNTYTGYYLNDTGDFVVSININILSITAASGVYGIFIGVWDGTQLDILAYKDFNGGIDVDNFYATFNVSINEQYLGKYLVCGNSVIAVDFTYTSYWEVLFVKQYYEGASIQFKQIIPNSWLVSDILKGLADMFNLVFDTNTILKTVNIMCRDKWIETKRLPIEEKIIQAGYYDYNNIVNISDKIDMSKVSTKTLNNDKKRIFRQGYKTSDDTSAFIDEPLEVKTYESNTSMSDRYDLGVDYILNSFFSKTTYTNGDDIKFGSQNIQIPLIYNGNYITEPTATEPSYDDSAHILFWGGQDNVYGKINCDLGAGVTDVFLPAAFMTNYLDTNGFDVSLSYSDEKLISNNIARGLKNTFFLNTIQRNIVGLTIEEYFLLSQIDILNFSFRQVWEMNGIRVLPIELNYIPQNNTSTKVKLLVDGVVFNNENILNTKIGGMAFGSAGALQIYLLSKGNTGVVVDLYIDNLDGTESFSILNISGFSGETFASEEITYFEDLTGWLYTLEFSVFNACFNLTDVILPNVSSIGGACFIQCSSLTILDFPNITNIGSGCFASCTNLSIINIPMCNDLGGSVIDTSVFDTINSGNPVTLTVSSYLQTCNSGFPDDDITYLITNNIGSIINYI